MSPTDPRLGPYAAGGWRRWSARRVAGWTILGVAILYALLLIDAAVGFTWWISDDYDATGTFAFDAFAPLRALTLPGSYWVPRLVVDGDDIMTTGVYLGVVAAAQAGLIACLGWALVVRRWPQRIAPGVVAVLLVGVLAVVNVLAYEAAPVLPDRSSPAVAADEARLAALVAQNLDLDRAEGPTTCRVRLLAREGSTAYVNTACRRGENESAGPAKVTGTTVTFPRDGEPDDLAALFPRDVRRVLAEQSDAAQP